MDLSYLPGITLQNKATREIKTTTDPGRALITGLWKDVGKVKGPILRGLAEPPTLFPQRVGHFAQRCFRVYDRRFKIGFTAQEKTDLIAFLNAL